MERRDFLKGILVSVGMFSGLNIFKSTKDPVEDTYIALWDSKYRYWEVKRASEGNNSGIYREFLKKMGNDKNKTNLMVTKPSWMRRARFKRLCQKI